MVLTNSRDSRNGQTFGRSFRGFNWKLAKANERLVAGLAQKLEIPEILAIILFNRGILDAESAEAFLDPKLRHYMPNPFDLKDMKKAAARIASAIINKEKVAVFGDYDVDGATSTALLKRFFRDLGRDVEIYIPNRMLEGYGPSAAAFQKLKDNGNTLIITVDCGTVSFEALEHAHKMGVDVVVLDHHLGPATLPPAHAIVNPNRVDDDFEYKSIAAVGVSFLTLVAVRSELRDAGFFTDAGPEIDLMKYLDLVALGTVCDVMSLTGINRAFVTQGLKLIASRSNAGLAVLSNVAKLDASPHSYHLGFVIGPRINAGGRVGEGMLGSELLSTDDSDKALEIAMKLEKLNDERRAIEAITIEEVFRSIEENKLYEKPIIVVNGEGWHQGILGIIASRVKEKYGRPAAIISFVGDVGKGSARSVTGIDLGSLLSTGKSMGLLTEGGGHAMAGGFSVLRSKLNDFYEYACDCLKNTEEFIERAKDIKIDAALSLSAINGKLVKTINKAAPFGVGNSQPRFVVNNVIIVDARTVGRDHVMFIVADKKTDTGVACTVKCMLFKAVDTEIGNFILTGIGKTISILGTIQAHYLDDRKADFVVEDISIS